MFKALENHFVSFLLIIALAALTTLTAFPTLTTPTAHAAVPHYLGYEGYLTDTSDNAITNTYSLTFRIYDAVTAGSLLWTETHSSVTVTKGYFSVQLGSVTALNLDFEDPYWISFQVASDVEMTPRQPINSVGFSYMSDTTYGAYSAAAAPASPSGGQMYYNTTTGKLYLYDDVAPGWVDATSLGLWTDGTYAAYISNDDVVIGTAGDADIANVGFSLTGDDLYVTGDIGVEGTLYTDTGLNTDTISEATGAAGVTIDSITLKGGTNTYNITNGTAILDVAADSTLDVDANLTVESASFINQDLTTNASVAFTGLSNTDANITAVGDIALDSISSAGSHISIAATNSTAMLQIGDGTYGWDHSPMVGIEGILEVDGQAYFDTGVTTTGTYGSTSNQVLQTNNFTIVNSGSTDDGIRWGIDMAAGHGNGNLILTANANRLHDHDHEALSTNPTMFIHSVLDPVTDNGEYLGLSYLGLSGGTMETNRPTFDLTLQSVAPFGTALGANGDGADIILQTSSPAGEGTLYGVTSVGANTNGHSLSAFADSLFVDGRFEVNGMSYLDGGGTLGDYFDMAGKEILFGTNRGDYGTMLSHADDGFVIAVGAADGAGNRNLIITNSSNYNHDHDHETLSANPTMFIHSVLDPDTDNGEYLGLSYLGLSGGIMENDRPTFDMTLQSVAPNAGATGTNANGADIILQTSSHVGASTVHGVTSIGANTNNHTISNTADSLFVDGKFEVDGQAYFDGGSNSATAKATIFALSTSVGGAGLVYTKIQTDDGYHVALDATDGQVNNNMIITTMANADVDHDHEAVSTDPTVFIHSVLGANVDNSEYLGLSYLGLSGGTMETNRPTFDLTLQSVAPFGTALGANGDGADIILQTSSPAGEGTLYGVTSVGANTNSHSLSAVADSLFVDGRLEVDGAAYFDSTVESTSSITGANIYGGNSGGAGISTFSGTAGFFLVKDSVYPFTLTTWSDDGVHLGLEPTEGKGNFNLIITSHANKAMDHNHDVASANPTIFIHSATAPTSDDKENLSISWNTLQMADEGATISNANAFSILGADGGTNGAGGTGGNITITAGDAQGSGDNAGGILRLDGGVKTGDGVAGYVSIGTGAPGHTPDEDSLYVEGILEVNGTAYFDSSVTVSSLGTGATSFNTYWIFGAAAAGYGGMKYNADDGSYLVVGTTDNAGNRHMIFTDASNWSKNHGHDTLSANPTMFIHSATDPTSDGKENLAISWNTLQMADEGATISNANAFSILGADGGSNTTGGTGGNITITAGDAKGSDANAGGILRLDGGANTGAGAPGYVSIGTGSARVTTDEDSLYVAGTLEVDGTTFLDGALTLGAGQLLQFGGSLSNYGGIQPGTDDGLRILVGHNDNTGNRNIIIGNAGDYLTSHGHNTLSANPTVFIHSALGVGTDNGEYLGLSYLGLSGGTMSTDRATFDMTLQSVAPKDSATGVNKDGADIILQTSSPTNGGAVYGVTSVGANGNGHSIDDTANSLFVDGKLEVDGNAYFDAGQTGNTTQVNAATYDLLVTDYILAVDYTGTGAVTSLTLPTAQCNDSTDSGREIHIVDTGGNAGVNNITIDTQGEETISGAATQVINANYNSYSITCYNSKWYLY